MTLALSSFYFGWWSILMWLMEDERISRGDIWAVQIATICTFIGERAFAYWRESRQRRWDLEDRRESRLKHDQQVWEVKEEVQETHRKLDDGLQTKVNDVLRRFDELPKQLAQEPTVLSDEATEKVAEKVAHKVINGGKAT